MAHGSSHAGGRIGNVADARAVRRPEPGPAAGSPAPAPPAHSLVNGQPVWGYVAPRLINSAVLMGVTGVIGAVAGVALGALAALRRDGWFDHASAVTALAVTALPEFVVAIGLII